MITLVVISVAITSLLVGVFLGIYISFLADEKHKKKKKKKKKLPFPECELCDPNQCDTWCMAKERFKNNPPLD